MGSTDHRENMLQDRKGQDAFFHHRAGSLQHHRLGHGIVNDSLRCVCVMACLQRTNLRAEAA